MKSKGKIFSVVILSFLLTFSFSVFGYAASDSKEERIYDSSFQELYDATTPEIKEILETFGLNKIDYEALLSLSPKLILDTLARFFSENSKFPIKTILFYLLFSFTLEFLNTTFIKTDMSSTFYSTFIVIFSVLYLFHPLLTVISSAFSALKLAGGFLLNYIPVFSGLLIMHGKLLTYATYESFMLFFSNTFSVLNLKLFFPITQIMFVLNICSGLEKNSFFQSIFQLVKKIGTFILSLSSTFFTGFLVLKSNLTMSGDGVAIRGIKMAVGTAVPIIGSSLSDACNALLGSFSLMKNTIGIFAILVIALLFLPSIIELTLWYICLEISSSFFSSIDSKAKNMLKGVSSILSFVIVIMIFSFFVFSISTGILFQTKN